MAWPKGKPRPPDSGRKKGTPNRNTQDLQTLCEEKGLNVFQAMVEMVFIADDWDKKFSALKELAQYLYPKRKAIEHSGQISNPYMEKSLEELERLVKDKLKMSP